MPQGSDGFAAAIVLADAARAQHRLFYRREKRDTSHNIAGRRGRRAGNGTGWMGMGGGLVSVIRCSLYPVSEGLGKACGGGRVYLFL